MSASKCEGNPKLDMGSPKVESVGRSAGKSGRKRKGYGYVNYGFGYVRDMKKLIGKTVCQSGRASDVRASDNHGLRLCSPNHGSEKASKKIDSKFYEVRGTI